MNLPVDSRALVLSFVIAGFIFVCDLMAGANIAVSVAYVGLVLVSFGSSWSPFALWLAALASVLVVVGQLASMPDFALSDLANRGLALLVVWLTAFLCSRHVRKALEKRSAEGPEPKERNARTAKRAVRALRSERDARMLVEEELEETEQRYRAVFNQTYQFAAILNPVGTVKEINETLRGIGFPRAVDIAHAPLWELPIWNVKDRGRLHNMAMAAAAGDFVREEFRLQPSGGDDMIVDLSLKPIRNSLGHVDFMILEARDITQEKRDQSQLIQTQKMEVLGQFASGIAHDFNNLLTVIAGNLELAERRSKGNEAALKHITKATTAVFRGRSLTDRILAFARKKQLEPQSVDGKALIAEAISLSKSGLDENTAIVGDVASDLWLCWADPAQLQTALLNLLINARDAMPNGGDIVVRASNRTLRPGQREDRPDLPDGDYVVLTVSDEGEGVPASIMDKITDPFFTTKESGSGSGLGLSMVSAFIKQSDGDLVIESAEGKGTTVSLFLPRSQHPVRSPDANRDTSIARGEGHVLVAEDDRDVREAVVAMLKDLGYRVDQAANSDEARTLLQSQESFDLLLTDITMPGDADGRDLGSIASSILPGLAILYSSGRPEMMVEISSTKGTREDFIVKPYHYAELAQKIEGLLSPRDKAD